MDSKNRFPRQPRVTVIGGGTGLSTMLRGLKRYTTRITAIVLLQINVFLPILPCKDCSPLATGA